ncbi:hypothetical protein OAP57_00330, partial [bacterium]|nr:hypothetical protein [bacterium]
MVAERDAEAPPIIFSTNWTRSNTSVVPSEFTLQNSIFTNSILSFLAVSSYASSLIVDKCTFNNVILYHDGYDATQFHNSIFWPSLNFNNDQGSYNSSPIFTYCLNAPNYGTGNIVGSPLFVDSENENFSLRPASPAIDAGNPLIGLDPDSTRADIGAIYYNQLGEYQAEIVSIDDVQDDQGGAVRITWTPSPSDIEYGNISHYGLWRVLDNSTNDGLGQIPAIQGNTYQSVIATLHDSIFSGTNWETFFITAHTEDPWIFYTSNVDSGYSVDNIAPYAPDFLNTIINSNGLNASWEDTDNPDIYVYEIHKNGVLFLETSE